MLPLHHIGLTTPELGFEPSPSFFQKVKFIAEKNLKVTNRIIFLWRMLYQLSYNQGGIRTHDILLGIRFAELILNLERLTRFELVTSCLASKYSTNWATAAYFTYMVDIVYYMKLVQVVRCTTGKQGSVFLSIIYPIIRHWQGRGSGAPWQNRTAITWLQNRCSTIKLIGRILVDMSRVELPLNSVWRRRTTIMLHIHGPGLSQDVTSVANVCGKEWPYKLYHMEDNCENNVAGPALVAKTFPCYLALLTASY